jgi:hypothetical protein
LLLRCPEELQEPNDADGSQRESPRRKGVASAAKGAQNSLSFATGISSGARLHQALNEYRQL